MAHSHISRSLLVLVKNCRTLNAADPLTQCLAPRLRSGFATEARLPVRELAEEIKAELDVPPKDTGTPDAADLVHPVPSVATRNPTDPTSRILTTLYSWPELEPQSFAWYDKNQLDLPLRRDILHRAVVFEADATRQGTASTKWRDEVHGSGRKLLPQKGTGRARVGDRKSPIRRGGGVAFGPKPRDFSTELQRKVYDIAWRTALSYRYRRGELIVLSGPVTLPQSRGPQRLTNIFEGNRWGKADGRSLLVTLNVRTHLFENMREVGQHGLVKDIEDVDVKDLLETGRVVIEQRALDTLLKAHSSDLGLRLSLKAAMKRI